MTNKVQLQRSHIKYMGHFINNAQCGSTAECYDVVPVKVTPVTGEYLRKQHMFVTSEVYTVLS